ncbi:MAG: DNRLRE domain-containing protein [Planctomycetaceae bacterium]|nr:DNRLRE domain-containing protein [Planctomycetaceae bacterium]
MKKLCFLLFAAWVLTALSSSGQAGTAEINASQGKATDASNPNAVSSETRIATRSSTFPDAKKSWLQFDLTELYAANPLLQGNITNATLKFYGAKTETANKQYVVNGLNDAAGLENWTASALTWNNAPANDTASGTALTAGLTTLLYTGVVLPPCEGILTETPEADRAALTAFVNTDTDGKITFIFTAGQTTYLYNAGADLKPVLVVEGNIRSGEVCQNIGTPYVAYAEVSCRTEGATNANNNMHNSAKLSVRSSSNGNKSWIRFNLNGLGMDPNNLRAATLRLTLSQGKPGAQTCDVSAVNDNCLDNIAWAETAITWVNAPGNDAMSLSALDVSKTTFMGRVSFTDGLIGQQLYVNVLPAIQADSDGIVQFVLHNSANLLDFATHDHASGEEYWPRLDILEAPVGADNPYPCPGQVVSSDLEGLVWTNPEPNEPADFTCTVYLGTEPNRPDMDSVVLPLNAHAVTFDSNFGNLQNLTHYYWIVDCYNETTSTMLPGLVWDFDVNNNVAPIVNAGTDQDLWGLPKTVNLDGNVTDDGLPNPPATYTVQWTQVDNGAPAVTPSPADAVDTSVVITERGDYEFTLTADDGAPNNQGVSSDTVRIVVGEDSCDATHLKSGADYAAGDLNEDCIIDMEDFAALAANWMNCTDDATHCL